MSNRDGMTGVSAAEEKKSICKDPTPLLNDRNLALIFDQPHLCSHVCKSGTSI